MVTTKPSVCWHALRSAVLVAILSTAVSAAPGDATSPAPLRSAMVASAGSAPVVGASAVAMGSTAVVATTGGRAATEPLGGSTPTIAADLAEDAPSTVAAHAGTPSLLPLVPMPVASVSATPSAPSAAPSSSAVSNDAVPNGAVPNGAVPVAGERVSAGSRVRIAEQDILTLRVSAASRSADERARLANKALAALLHEEDLPEIEVLLEGVSAAIYADRKLVLRLYHEDAEASVSDGPPPSLEDLAEKAASDIRWALNAERTRGRVANSVLAISLVVLFGLIAFFLMRRVATLGQKARSWIDEHEEKLRLRVRDLEILGPEALQSASVIGLSLVVWVGQVAIVYTWLVASLSLFPATRDYTRDLTGLIFRPVSDLATRIASTLPGLFVAGVAALVVFLLVRFVSLFFASVAKRENTLSWVAPDLALPVSVLLRFAIITAALLFATPIVTGDPNGTLPRLGVAVLGALALASTPLLASGIVGGLAVLRRRLRVGDYVRIGDLSGRVVRLTLLEVRLETALGHEARIPAFALLHTPLVRLGTTPRIAVEIGVRAGSDRKAVERVLLEAARSVGSDADVELLAASADEYRYQVRATCASLTHAGTLLGAAVDAVLEAGMELAGCAQSRPK